MSELRGRCLAVTGYEEDYLDFVDQRGAAGRSGITSLIRAAGSPDMIVDWAEKVAFEREGTSWDGEEWAEHRREYQERTGRQRPPILAVRIVTEVTEAPPEETEAYWAAERARQDEVPCPALAREPEPQ